MQQHKCPGCGATIFTNAAGPSDYRETTVACQYCGSQFTVGNPNYREPHQPQVVNYTYNSTSYTYTDYSGRSSAWKSAGKGQHKFASIAFIILSFIAGLVAALMLLGGFTTEDKQLYGIAAFFGGMAVIFYLGGAASRRELKRRQREGVNY